MLVLLYISAINVKLDGDERDSGAQKGATESAQLRHTEFHGFRSLNLMALCNARTLPQPLFSLKFLVFCRTRRSRIPWIQQSEPMRLECGNPSRTIVFIEIPAGFAELGPPESHGFRSLNLMTLECSNPSTTIVFIKNHWVLRRFWKHRGQAQRAQRATERNREHRKQAQRTQGATEPIHDPKPMESIQKTHGNLFFTEIREKMPFYEQGFLLKSF